MLKKKDVKRNELNRKFHFFTTNYKVAIILDYLTLILFIRVMIKILANKYSLK